LRVATRQHEYRKNANCKCLMRGIKYNKDHKDKEFEEGGHWATMAKDYLKLK